MNFIRGSAILNLFAGWGVPEPQCSMSNLIKYYHLFLISPGSASQPTAACFVFMYIKFVEKKNSKKGTVRRLAHFDLFRACLPSYARTEDKQYFE